MEHLLNKLNTTVEQILEKVNTQNAELAKLSVKVDMYRDMQNEHSRKLEIVDKVSIEAMQSTRAAHKRIDELEESFDKVITRPEHESHDERLKKLEKLVYWVGTTIIGSVILAALGLIVTK